MLEASNTILQAFGNASTRRNANSSRFGKYVRLQYDAECQLDGATTATYLLEKSRIVHQAEGERSFHVWYQLLLSAAQQKGNKQPWTQLFRQGPDAFAYLQGTKATSAATSEYDSWSDTQQALQTIGLDQNAVDNIVQTLSIVLQLGNLSFSPHATDDDKAQIAVPAELQELARLMGASTQLEELQTALLQRTVVTRSETYKVPLSPAAAKESCDALAKFLYDKLFVWLVDQINSATAVVRSTTRSSQQQQQLRHIGLLDIFGFESYSSNNGVASNGFEQLCINYANEKLQQKFTHDVFRQVEAEYEFEGIALKPMDAAPDNNAVVSLIEAKMGLMAMLNEECVRPRGNDREFVYKTIAQHKASPALLLDKQYSAMEFGIQHYCTAVVYDATGFVRKNNDLLATDLESCVQKAMATTNPIIAAMKNVEMASTTTSSTVGSRKRSNVVAPSVWTKYRSSLSQLLEEIEKTNTRYIKCIKPNDDKKPATMTDSIVLQQLRSSGIVGAVEMTRSSFPNRLEHKIVVERFSSLLPGAERRGPVKSQKKIIERVRAILSACACCTNCQNEQMYAVGRTRTYFRTGILEQMESERMVVMNRSSIKIQSMARRMIVRLEHTGQSTRKQDSAARILQSFLRRRMAVIQLSKAKKNKQVESVRRMKAARIKRKRNKAAATIQAIVRGIQQRPRYRAALAEKQELSGISDQIAALKAKLAKSEEEIAEAVKDAEDRVTKAMAAMKDEGINSAELQNISSKAKLEESGKVIDFLKRERKRLMGLAKTHKDRCDRTVEQQKEMDEATEGIESRMGEVQKYMDILKNNESVLAKNKEAFSDQIKAYRTEILKIDAHVKNEEDVTAVYRDAVGRIVSLVQEECKDDELVEDVYLVAMENCELTLDKANLGDDDDFDEDDLDLDALDEYSD